MSRLRCRLAPSGHWLKSVACGLGLIGGAAAVHAGEPAAVVGTPAAVVTVPAGEAAPAAAREHYGLWETIRGSVCKSDDGPPWTPLCCSTLLSEGWCQPWISPPAGSGGAPRQG